jgi:cell division protease FtsH
MVREFGMSPRLGPVGYASGSPMYLGDQEVSQRSYAEATQHLIDEEVSRLLQEAERSATQCLIDNREHLDRLVELLIERETVDGEDVYALIGRQMPGHHEPSLPVPAHRATDPDTPA